MNIEIPIIALTAFSKLEIEAEAYNSGMNSIVVKPYKSKELFAIISDFINKTKNAD